MIVHQTEKEKKNPTPKGIPFQCELRRRSTSASTRHSTRWATIRKEIIFCQWGSGGFLDETLPVPFTLCWWKPSFLLVLISFVTYCTECVVRSFVNFLGFAVIKTKFAEWGICVRSVNCSHHSHDDNMKANFAASLCFRNCYELHVLLFSHLELGLGPSVLTVLKFDKMTIPVRRG